MIPCTTLFSNVIIEPRVHHECQIKWPNQVSLVKTEGLDHPGTPGIRIRLATALIGYSFMRGCLDVYTLLFAVAFHISKQCAHN